MKTEIIIKNIMTNEIMKTIEDGDSALIQIFMAQKTMKVNGIHYRVVDSGIDTTEDMDISCTILVTDDFSVSYEG